MRRVVLLVSFALIAGSVALGALPEALSYRGKPGDTLPVQSRFTFDLAVSGPPAFVSQLRASNPILTIERLVSTRKGRRTIAAGDGVAQRVEIAFDTAHVELRTADRMLMFDFDQSVRPETLKDPLAQASWGLGFAPRSYTVGLLGEYEPAMRTDAQAEAMGVMVDGVVRFPARQVNVGDTWNTEWAGVRRQTETGGFFRFAQTAEFQQMIPGPSPRARIGYTTRGRIEISPERNKQQEETTVEGKGWILLDLQTGTVVGLDVAGTITMNLKTPGITITRTMTASY